MHFDIETALDFLEGRLTDTTTWTAHLDTCPSCAAEMNRWADIHAAVKRTHLQSAPSELIASAAAIFKPAPKAAANTIRRVIATLIFDSFAQPAFAGARGQTATRQVVLRAEDFDIHVRISHATENRELLGQIQPRGSAAFVDSARLHLLRDGERIRSSDVNQFGEFHFGFVPDGFLSLQVDLPHLTVIGALSASQRA